ncbi:MAG: hypothetical protein ACKVRP_03380 [Bacteroidota bacterium]
MNANAPFHRKYVPRKLSEMVGVDYLQPQFAAFANQKTIGGLIFFGPNGYGKTTLAEILLRRMFCERPTGLDACLDCNCCRVFDGETVWSDYCSLFGERITPEISKYLFMKFFIYAPSTLYVKTLLINDLDRADMSFLLSIPSLLDEYPLSPMLFTVTNIERIPNPVRQRCKIITMKDITPVEFSRLIRRVCKTESIRIEDENAITLLKRMVGNNPRIALTVLETIKNENLSLSVEALQKDSVTSCLGVLTGESISS